MVPVLADQVSTDTDEENDLKALVWEEVVTKSQFLKQKQFKEKRLSNAVIAAQLVSLASIACWVFSVWPTPDHGSKSDQTITVQLPNTQKGFFLRTITNGVLGAIGILSVNFFMKLFDKLGGLAQTGGVALASSVGITCDKPVHKVEKYQEIVLELTGSAISSARENQASNSHQKIQQQEIIKTNTIVLVHAIEIMLARMILEVEIVRKQSRISANAAFKVIRHIFETTNQSICIIRERLEKQENALDVLEHWLAQLKDQGNRFKLFAWSSDY